MEQSLPKLTVSSFTKGFVAKLIGLGETAIYPKSEGDRQAFSKVIELLNGEIYRLKASSDAEDREFYKSLVVLRNQLQASSTGAFDAFETALRNQQLSFTNSPNPFYDEISFSVSQPFAEKVFSEMPARHRTLITELAEKFREVRRVPVRA